MVKYFASFDHTNGSDNEETVLTLTSCEEEKIKIDAIHILSETNEGILTWYIEREKIGEHRTGVATIQNELIREVNAALEVGKTFKITLRNKISGTNAAVVGAVEYEIT